MENQPWKSITSIHNRISSASINSNAGKFRKVTISFEEQDLDFRDDVVFKNAVRQCENFKQQILGIQTYVNGVTQCVKPHVGNQNDLQEPQGIQVKFAPNIQKTKHPTINRSKSTHNTLKSKQKTILAERGKSMTVKRLSSKLQERVSLASSQNPQKQTKSIYKDTNNLLELSRFNKNRRQSGIRAVAQKKVRLKTNSLTSLQSQEEFQKRHQKCIPLNKSRPSMELEESFLENAYRLRKCVFPIWQELSTIYKKDEKKKRFQQQNKEPLLSKQNKKLVYEGYDFDGKLIPSANQPPKGKKTQQEEVSEVNIDFFQDIEIENLENYHDRHQRNAKTYKEIKLKTFDCNNQESEFLTKAQTIKLKKGVQNSRHQETPRNDAQNAQNSQTNLNIEQPKTIESFQNNQFKVDTIRDSETNICENEELMENFDRIRFGNSQAQVNEGNTFQFGLTKYVKVKKFQQKQTKSKSHNYCPVSYKMFEAKQAKTFKIKSQYVKSSQKIRANKRLFKQIFNMSLKKIQAQNRQDILTSKLIQQEKTKQKEEEIKNKTIQRQQQRQGTRYSDTQLLKKGFCLKPTIFKQMKEVQENQKAENPNDTVKPSNPKYQTHKCIRSSQEMAAEGKKHQSKPSHLGFLDSRVTRPSIRNSIGDQRSSIGSQNIQKLFKKQTKKILIKQAPQEFRRQSFV